MKLTIMLLFIILTTFSGVQHGELEQEPTQVPVQVLKPVETQIEKKTDSIKVKYYEEIKDRNVSIDKLIKEKKDGDKENMKLHAEIKRLKKINEYLKQNIDTVYIHDTMFKKRKLLQLFKNPRFFSFRI